PRRPAGTPYRATGLRPGRNAASATGLSGSVMVNARTPPSGFRPGAAVGNPASALPGSGSAAASPDEVRRWLQAVPDPEIPVLSVVDLGVVRDVGWDGDACVVTI